MVTFLHCGLWHSDFDLVTFGNAGQRLWTKLIIWTSTPCSLWHWWSHRRSYFSWRGSRRISISSIVHVLHPNQQPEVHTRNFTVTFLQCDLWHGDNDLVTFSSADQRLLSGGIIWWSIPPRILWHWWFYRWSYLFECRENQHFLKSVTTSLQNRGWEIRKRSFLFTFFLHWSLA